MTTFKKLLVPVDGSPPSNAAVTLATRLAQDQGGELILLHVCEVAKIVAMTSAPSMGVGIDPSYALTAEHEAGEHALNDALAQAKSSSVQARALTVEGSCVDTILDAARRYDADLIVIGSHGRGGISRAVMGSVAEGVLRRAGIPVLATHAHANGSVH